MKQSKYQLILREFDLMRIIPFIDGVLLNLYSMFTFGSMYLCYKYYVSAVHNWQCILALLIINKLCDNCSGLTEWMSFSAGKNTHISYYNMHPYTTTGPLPKTKSSEKIVCSLDYPVSRFFINRSLKSKDIKITKVTEDPNTKKYSFEYRNKNKKLTLILGYKELGMSEFNSLKYSQFKRIPIILESYLSPASLVLDKIKGI